MKAFFLFLITLCFLGLAEAKEKEKFLAVSWGDVIYGREGVAQLETPGKVRKAVKR